MNILAVDTAGKTAGVALLQDDRLLYEVYLDGGMTHSETLMPMIDTCLKLCGLTCAQIDLYAVNAGPGSFTGLRIGLAAVKGLAFPRETLCAPVSTLEALAAAHTGEGTVLCALDARRAQVYSAAFDLATHTRLLHLTHRSGGQGLRSAGGILRRGGHRRAHRRERQRNCTHRTEQAAINCMFHFSFPFLSPGTLPGLL